MRLIILSAVVSLAMVSVASAQPVKKCLILEANDDQAMIQILRVLTGTPNAPAGGLDNAQLAVYFFNKLTGAQPCPSPAPPAPPAAAPAPAPPAAN